MTQQEPTSYARAKAFNALTQHPDCLLDDMNLNDLIDDIARAIDEARALADDGLKNALERARTILGNMALENEGAIFTRWPISHEPLRSDARNLLPVIDAALANGEQLRPKEGS